MTDLEIINEMLARAGQTPDRKIESERGVELIFDAGNGYCAYIEFNKDGSLRAVAHGQTY